MRLSSLSSIVSLTTKKSKEAQCKDVLELQFMRNERRKPLHPILSFSGNFQVPSLRCFQAVPLSQAVFGVNQWHVASAGHFLLSTEVAGLAMLRAWRWERWVWDAAPKSHFSMHFAGLDWKPRAMPCLCNEGCICSPTVMLLTGQSGLSGQHIPSQVMVLL